MKKKEEKIYSTRQEDGSERPHVLVTVPLGQGQAIFLVHSWGVIDDFNFFDTHDGQHVELHGPNISYILQVPEKGMTFELDGTLRQCKKEEPKVIIQ